MASGSKLLVRLLASCLPSSLSFALILLLLLIHNHRNSASVAHSSNEGAARRNFEDQGAFLEVSFLIIIYLFARIISLAGILITTDSGEPWHLLSFHELRPPWRWFRC